MSDTVERLRELESVERELACECDCPPEATANYRYAMTCAEAADLITALRAEVEDLGNRLHHVHRLWANNEHALRAENERLRTALRDARECVQAWSGYASEYFREKHDLAGDLARIDAALEEKP